MSRRAVGWLVAGTAVVAALAVVAVPVWLIQPFAPQTPGAVAWSWRLRQIAPWVTAAAAVVVFGIAVTAWRSVPPSGATRRPWTTALRRTALVALTGVAVCAAWFARQNHFEWMFRPLPDPTFIAAATVTDAAADEPVLGVTSDGVALAFPITLLGYHHLVNATLGDTPIVATY